MPLASIGLASLVLGWLAHCSIQHQNRDVALYRTNCAGQGCHWQALGRVSMQEERQEEEQEQEKRRPRPRRWRRIIVVHTGFLS